MYCYFYNICLIVLCELYAVTRYLKCFKNGFNTHLYLIFFLLNKKECLLFISLWNVRWLTGVYSLLTINNTFEYPGTHIFITPFNIVSFFYFFFSKLKYFRYLHACIHTIYILYGYSWLNWKAIGQEPLPPTNLRSFDFFFLQVPTKRNVCGYNERVQPYRSGFKSFLLLY